MADYMDNDGKASPPNVSVLVKTSITDEKVVDVVAGSAIVETILDAVAGERGCAVEELVLVRDGEQEPLAYDVVVEANYPYRRRHHVHYAGEVKITVNYQAGSHYRDFRRHATVGDILSWAIDVFEIDPSMATEFELARHGAKEELPTTEHIGHLAGERRELELDLVRGDIANGDCR